jgi:4-phospho-D-threonate 3-dehydrogenase / 4-phospho-D-erythronate 3-dehydrogenase
MNHMQRPIIAVTMGDPAGIGPEITLKALSNQDIYKVSKPLVIGDYRILSELTSKLTLSLQMNPIKNPEEGRYTYGVVDVISMDEGNQMPIQMGKVQAISGERSYLYIKKAAELAMNHRVCAVATNPINKESIQCAKIPYIGHTEMFEGLTDCKHAITMFHVRNLRVFFLSRHLALRNACDYISKASVLKGIQESLKALTLLGLEEGVLAVAGLNPHNGEHGLFGDEEDLFIEPAILEAKKQGLLVEGPIPADSVFFRALQGKYNGVLSLYHDQGHIATKTLDFERTISLTLNMPFLRASVDHGTAFDIAGQGIASSVSLEEAIYIAVQYGEKYRLAWKTYKERGE